MVNVYMNEFDQFVKRKLKAKYYVRYCDDFVIVSENRNDLKKLVPIISEFLETRLKLSLNPKKVSIKTFSSGVDFLGWVNFPHHRVLRTATKRRMKRRLNTNSSAETISSYLGLLSHGNAHKLSTKTAKHKMLDIFCMWYIIGIQKKPGEGFLKKLKK